MPDYTIGTVEVTQYDPVHTINLRVNASTTVYCGQLLSVNTSGEWILADQDGTYPCDAVALKDGAAGEMLTGLLYARLSGTFSSLTTGLAVQLSDIAGYFEDADGNHQVVGLCISSTKVIINIGAFNYSVS